MDTVTQLHAVPPPGRELVDSAELALLREQARLAAVLCTEIYKRRTRRWYRVPMSQVEALTAKLLEGWAS